MSTVAWPFLSAFQRNLLSLIVVYTVLTVIAGATSLPAHLAWGRLTSDTEPRHTPLLTVIGTGLALRRCSVRTPGVRGLAALPEADDQLLLGLHECVEESSGESRCAVILIHPASAPFPHGLALRLIH